MLNLGFGRCVMFCVPASVYLFLFDRLRHFSLLAGLIVAAVLSLTQVGTSFAADEKFVMATGEAKMERDAKIEAYYTAIIRELAGLAGAQAEGEIGKKFHDDMSRDPDTFLKRYFQSDLKEHCVTVTDKGVLVDPKVKKGSGFQVRCDVQGTLKLLALQNDYRDTMKSTERRLSNTLTFALSANDVADPHGSYVVDKLTSAFLKSGFKVLSNEAVDEALAAKKIDFSLAIIDMQYSPARWNNDPQFWDKSVKGSYRANGSLVVRFKLFDLKGSTQVASVPVTKTLSLTGAAEQDVIDPLRDQLASEAAAEIGRQVSAAVVTFQTSRDKDQAASERSQSGERLYTIRVDGVTQRDRDKLKALRDVIKSVVATATPEVDPSASNATSTILNFSAPGKIDAEDMLDALFAANKADKNFNAKYEGNNAFVISY